MITIKVIVIVIVILSILWKEKEKFICKYLF